MKKLDRLSKQIANVDEVDPRLGVQIRKLAQLMLQDAKFAIIKHRSAQSDSSSSSSRNSPSAPSTPIRTMTPPPSTIQRPSPVKSALSSSLSNNIVQVCFITFEIIIKIIPDAICKICIQNSTDFIPAT